jgi:hypothetical protein
VAGERHRGDECIVHAQRTECWPLDLRRLESNLRLDARMCSTSANKKYRTPLPSFNRLIFAYDMHAIYMRCYEQVSVHVAHVDEIRACDSSVSSEFFVCLSFFYSICSSLLPMVSRGVFGSSYVSLSRFVIVLDGLWSWRFAFFPRRLLHCVLVFTALQHLRCPVLAACARSRSPASQLARNVEFEPPDLTKIGPRQC